MAKKRLVIDLDESQHKALVVQARAADLTLSNYVRKELGLPAEQQGRRVDLKKSRKVKGK